MRVQWHARKRFTWTLIALCAIANAAVSQSTMETSVDINKEQQKAGNTVSNPSTGSAARVNPNAADELGIVMLLLTTGSDPKLALRDPLLARKAIPLLAKNVMVTTPSHLYVFTHESQRLHQAFDFTEEEIPSARLHIESIPAEHWIPPHQAADPDLWVAPKRWTLSYRLMGEWRLKHMPAIMKARGHRYLLQIDADSFVCEKIAINIVQELRNGGYYLGARDITSPHVSLLPLWGLPELTKYFLITERIKPLGPLFENCEPRNMSGLYTRQDFCKEIINWKGIKEDCAILDGFGIPHTGGWSARVLYGNFIAIDLEFWYRSDVQRFIELCRDSGGSVRYRWNEQGVYAMLWQIFVSKAKLYRFKFAYKHSKVIPTDCPGLV